MNARNASHISPMARFLAPLAPAIAALALSVAPTCAQEAAPSRDDLASHDLAQAFRDLSDPTAQNWRAAESDIRRAWSRSGSAAMDLLLQRGEGALDSGDAAAALDHLTALTDHAPDFAEGWEALSQAYLASGQMGPAVNALSRTLQLEPRQWEALASLGAVLEAIGDAPRARAAYQASFALNPHQSDVKDAIERLDPAGANVAL